MKKKTKGNSIRHYYVDVFDTDIVLVSCEIKDILDELSTILPKARLDLIESSLKEQPIEALTKARQYPMDGGGSVIWIGPEQPLSVLVHELMHATFHLLEVKGVKYCSDSEEVYTYLMESMFKGLTR